MEKLAIRRGVCYEGDAHDLRAIYPTPVVSPAACSFISEHSIPEVVFREDSFDPVTRIRRGRFYVRASDLKDWPPGRVDHGFYHPYQGGSKAPPVPLWTPEAAYDAWQSNAGPVSVSGQVIRLGGPGFVTAWRVVGAEKVSTGHVLFTLRAVSFVGVVPELDVTPMDKNGTAVSTTSMHHVRHALDSLIDALHKQLTTPIVDVARETAKVILTAWIGPEAQGLDLADVIGKLPNDKRLTEWAGSIVNRLHSRGKSAVQESNKSKGAIIRTLDTEDAELSVQLVGFLLREIGWAQA